MPELCREHGINSATFHKLRRKFGGMDASLMARLKMMYAKARLKTEIAQGVLQNK